MSYITFYIDGLESFIDLSEYCIIQKSFNCNKMPSIIFHAKHNKDFMVIFDSIEERDVTFGYIISSLESSGYDSDYMIPVSHIEINSNSIIYKSKENK